MGPLVVYTKACEDRDVFTRLVTGDLGCLQWDLLMLIPLYCMLLRVVGPPGTPELRGPEWFLGSEEGD